ncbi:MAG: hypothetical protein HYX74_07385 [Acidobacteria bacterium]|nr:hypothetical protein [Acidobacteriota bacterium]
MTLRPEIGVEMEDSVSSAAALLHDAHQRCIVANSIRSLVIIERGIRVAGR